MSHQSPPELPFGAIFGLLVAPAKRAAANSTVRTRYVSSPRAGPGLTRSRRSNHPPARGAAPDGSFLTLT